MYRSGSKLFLTVHNISQMNKGILCLGCRSESSLTINEKMTSPIQFCAQEGVSMDKPIATRTVSDPVSGRGKVLSTSFRQVNDYHLSQLAFDMHVAVISGYQEAVRQILTSYPDVDVNISVKGTTVLSLSLYKRHFHIFSMLMKHHERSKKFDLNKCSKDHLNRTEPPVITATRMHFFEGVVALINAGADIDRTDNLGHTALWVAARQQMPDLVEYLISRGASVNKTDIYHYTPLLTAMMYRVSSIIIKMLITNGSSLEGPRYPANTQHSPLFWAVKHRSLELVKLMILAGVSNAEIRYVRKTMESRIDEDPVIIVLLEKEAKAPRSLKQLCRREIRKHLSDDSMSKNFVQRLKELPIPTILRQYLLLK